MRALAAAVVLLASWTTAAQPGAYGPPPLPPPLHPPEPRAWLGFAFGTGTGIIGGRTEGLEADVATGPQWAPLHVRAELGAIRTPHLAFAIAARVGFPLGVDIGDPPAAKAVLLRVYRLFGPLRVHAAVGAGYLRYRVGVDGTATDTMAAGPVLAGGGAGYVVPLSRSWRLTVDAGVLAAIAASDEYGGVPNEHALHFDLDVGLAVFR